MFLKRLRLLLRLQNLNRHPDPQFRRKKQLFLPLWNLRPARANNLQLLRKPGRKAPRRKKSISATRKNLTPKNKSWAKNLPPESRYTIS